MRRFFILVSMMGFTFSVPAVAAEFAAQGGNGPSCDYADPGSCNAASGCKWISHGYVNACVSAQNEPAPAPSSSPESCYYNGDPFAGDGEVIPACTGDFEMQCHRVGSYGGGACYCCPPAR